MALTPLGAVLRGREEPRRGEPVIVSRSESHVTIIVDEEICKGCRLCVAVCPRQAMQLADHTNSRGFHPACLANPDDCTGCAQCALMCPDVAIRIVRSE